MQLVKKRTPRGGHYRTLSAAERSAVLSVCGNGFVQSSAEKELAEQVLLEMRRHDVWLKCDCGKPEESPMNSCKRRSDTNTLFLSGFGHHHADSCALHRAGRGDDDVTAAGTRRDAGSKPVDLRSILPREEREARISTAEVRDGSEGPRSNRRRIPAIGRLLLTLIGEAGLNTLSTLYPAPESTPRKHIDALAAVTGQLEFARGRLLSEIIRFDAWLNENARESAIATLESEERHWPAGRARAFYLIFMSDVVSQESVTYIGPYSTNTFSPAKRMHINGEAGEGRRGDYWVILMFLRDESGRVICSEGYAHALFSRKCPVPVDSELERQTLRSILQASEWVSKGVEAPALSLQKPLFDIEVEVDGEKGWVLPDFILNATPYGRTDSATIVIETMGYTDENYAERKAVQHRGMKTLGKLQMDPPNWPEETGKALTNHLFGLIKNL